jgi:hypothetical protein
MLSYSLPQLGNLPRMFSNCLPELTDLPRVLSNRLAQLGDLPRVLDDCHTELGNRLPQFSNLPRVIGNCLAQFGDLAGVLLGEQRKLLKGCLDVREALVRPVGSRNQRLESSVYHFEARGHRQQFLGQNDAPQLSTPLWVQLEQPDEIVEIGDVERH